MDISKMLKRATCNVKYTVMTVVLVTVLMFSISSFVMGAVRGNFSSVFISVIGIASAGSVLVYALGFHEIMGAGIIPLISYFVFSTLMRVINLFSAMMTAHPLRNLINLVLVLIPIAVVIQLILGIRGFNIYFYLGIIVLYNLYGMIMNIVQFDYYPSFIEFGYSLFRSFFGVANSCVVAYLSANANK